MTKKAKKYLISVCNKNDSGLMDMQKKFLSVLFLSQWFWVCGRDTFARTLHSFSLK